MKYVDLVIQTLLFLFTAWILIYSYTEPNWPMAVLIPQMLLGSWQFLSSFLSVVTKAPLFKLKLWHLGLSIVYLALLGASGYMGLTDQNDQFLLTVPAWSLGFYYHVLTWKWILSRQKSHSSFLPHLNF